jgi:hypothetical protein
VASELDNPATLIAVLVPVPVPVPVLGTLPRKGGTVAVTGDEVPSG